MTAASSTSSLSVATLDEIAPAANGPRESIARSRPAPSTTPPGSPSPEFLSLIPHEFARRHLVLSAGRDGEHERVWIGQEGATIATFNVGVRLGRSVSVIPGPPESVAAAIDRAYAAHAVAAGSSKESPSDDTPRVVVEGSTDLEGDLSAALREVEADLLHTQGKAPVVRLVDLLLFEALTRQASDVHVQPLRDRTLVRYRLDGVLHTVRELPASLASAVVSRVKVMSRLDVAETRAPQDGRATVSLGACAKVAANKRRVDLRISTLPSTYGERVVIRILDASHSPHLTNFLGLGMPSAVQARFLEQVSRTSGIVLATGPTGSGKTTTLYTTLAWITQQRSGAALPDSLDPMASSRPAISRSGCEVNVMTIEDPVEYDLSTGMGAGGVTEGDEGGERGSGTRGEGGSGGGGGGLAISQTQVDVKKNVTFATGLRHILRQDPDVIMVGEIRDEETAKIAVQASLTGHLVLSTLHTNDAPSAVARLIDLGVEPFLVCSSLSAVLAQRLVRMIHAPCAGRGCAECLGTGFRGRTGVFELLVVDEAIRREIQARGSGAAIKAAAVQGGMVTLMAAGVHLVEQGLTTSGEVGRVIQGME